MRKYQLEKVKKKLPLDSEKKKSLREPNENKEDFITIYT